MWLAQDNKSGKAVALKTICSSANAPDEYEAHMDIAQRVGDCSRLVLCLDKFVLKRMDGNVERQYPVLVLPLRGPSLMTIQDTKRSLVHRMAAAKDLLQAILSIQSAGLVHRGKKPSHLLSSTAYQVCVLILLYRDRDIYRQGFCRQGKLYCSTCGDASIGVAGSLQAL